MDTDQQIQDQQPMSGTPFAPWTATPLTRIDPSRWGQGSPVPQTRAPVSGGIRGVCGADGWAAEDADGGMWWPDDSARAEIEASASPAARVVELAQTAPMRGRWLS